MLQTLRAVSRRFKPNRIETRLKDAVDLLSGHIEESAHLSILPGQVAMVKQAMGQTPYPTQIVAAEELLEGRLVNMETGEGKTLAAAMAAFKSAIQHGSVHIATMNDYLAKRDAEQFKAMYQNAGLSVAVVTADMMLSQKIEAYRANVVYGTLQSFASDYLQDGLTVFSESRLNTARKTLILDEVDSLLIDECLTPVAVASAKARPSLVETVFPLVELLKQDVDFTLSEEDISATLSDSGYSRLEKMFLTAGVLQPNESLYNNIGHVQVALQCLSALHQLKSDTHYIVDGEEGVVILDSLTGRKMPGRRWDGALHQAVEFKERVSLTPQRGIRAQISYRGFISQYKYVSGLSGTVADASETLKGMYGLETVSIPPLNRSQAVVGATRLVRTPSEQYALIVEDVKEAYASERPVLLVADSPEMAHEVSSQLSTAGIRHSTLTAQNDHMESRIVRDSGAPGSVTVMTKMAGRGVDIKLGGDSEAMLAQPGSLSDYLERDAQWTNDRQTVVNAGGLLVIGMYLPDSRRAETQIRGRAARQGDPGESRFVLSLQDPMIQAFGQESFRSMMKAMNLQDGEALQGGLLNRILARAQNLKVEHDRQLRHQYLQVDNAYEIFRRQFADTREATFNALEKNHGRFIEQNLPAYLDAAVDAVMPKQGGRINGRQVVHAVAVGWDLQLPAEAVDGMPADKAVQWLRKTAEAYYGARREALDVPDADWRKLEVSCVLLGMDEAWEIYMEQLEDIRAGVHLREYANQDASTEYLREAARLFDVMLTGLPSRIGLRLLGAPLAKKFIKKKAA